MARGPHQRSFPSTARARGAGGVNSIASFSGDSSPEPMVSSRWMPEAMKMASIPAASAPLRSVRSESPMARMRRRSTLTPRTALGRCLRGVVGVGVRLARPEHLPIHALVEIGDGAGADVLPPAHIHHKVGVGADKRQPARARALEQLAIVFRRLGRIVVEAGAEDGLCLLQWGRPGGQPLERCGVAVGRSDAEEPRIAFLGDVAQRDLAGCNDVVPGFARHASRIQHGGHALAGDRRVGDQDHGATARAKAQQRIASILKGAVAVVQHAPHVAEQHVVASKQLSGARQDGRGRSVAHAGRQVRQLD